MADYRQVIELHRKQPQLNASQIAARLDCTSAYVRATAQRRRLKLPGCTLAPRDADSLIALGQAARSVGWLTVEAIIEAAARLR